MTVTVDTSGLRALVADLNEVPLRSLRLFERAGDRAARDTADQMRDALSRKWWGKIPASVGWDRINLAGGARWEIGPDADAGGQAAMSHVAIHGGANGGGGGGPNLDDLSEAAADALYDDIADIAESMGL